MAAFYLLGVTLCLTRLVFSWRRAQRLMENAVPVTDTSVLTEYKTMGRRLGLQKTPALMASPVGNGPALVARRGGAVALLPEELLAAGAASERRLVLAHELAHAKRRDLAWDWLGVAAQTLFFFHPLVYGARREERAAREMACDALALSATGATPADYGHLLVNVAARASGRPAFAAGIGVVGAVEKGSMLMRRVENLGFASTGVRRAAAWGVAALVIVGFLPYRLTAQTVSSLPSTAAQTPKKEKIEEFRGVAVTESGKPVPGAIVRWLYSDGTVDGNEQKVIAEAKADAQGRFHFRLAPPRQKDGGRGSGLRGQWIAQGPDSRFGALLAVNLTAPTGLS